MQNRHQRTSSRAPSSPPQNANTSKTYIEAQTSLLASWHRCWSQLEDGKLRLPSVPLKMPTPYEVVPFVDMVTATTNTCSTRKLTSPILGSIIPYCTGTSCLGLPNSTASSSVAHWAQMATVVTCAKDEEGTDDRLHHRSQAPARARTLTQCRPTVRHRGVKSSTRPFYGWRVIVHVHAHLHGVQHQECVRGSSRKHKNVSA